MCVFIYPIQKKSQVVPFAPRSAKAAVFLGRQPVGDQALRQAFRLLPAQLCQAVLLGVQVVLAMADEEPGRPSMTPKRDGKTGENLGKHRKTGKKTGKNEDNLNFMEQKLGFYHENAGVNGILTGAMIV